jgi:exodeoxyribonuclease V alpha subunit
LEDDCRIILIGDINQLPPVQGRSVLGFAMIKWPTFTLEEIHRQAAGNPIIANAHQVLRGQYPTKDRFKFAMLQIPDGSIKAYNHVIGYIQELHKRSIFDPMRDALIVPQNKDTLGQLHLNERLVHYFNPQRKDENGTILNTRHIVNTGYDHVTYAAGDKIMILQNDRQLGLTNGMCGVVTGVKINGMYHGEKSTGYIEKFEGTLSVEDIANVDTSEFVDVKNEDESQRQASHILSARFETADGNIEVPFATVGQYRKITLAYAFTCHKSQGGEYPTVVIVLHGSNIRMLNREWLYTAITRAQEKIILLYNDRGLAQAINIQRIKGKTVKEKAQQFLMLQDKADTSLPDLPEPRRM